MDRKMLELLIKGEKQCGHRKSFMVNNLPAKDSTG
jgi:hypothetical protein